VDEGNLVHDASAGSWESHSGRRLVAAECVLFAALGLAAAVAAAWGWSHAGTRGLLAAGAAFLVCWTPNAVSLILVTIFRDPEHSLSAMLLSMMVRMGIPFGVALVLLQTKHWLVDSGALPMVLAMYLVALVVETGLSLWIVGAFRTPAVKAS
jgi:hypothetical protein